MSDKAIKKWNPWPASLIGFFTIAILSCAGFVVFCVSNPVELVSRDYYEQEIRHQSQMDRAERATELGNLATVAYHGDKRVLELNLPIAHQGATGEIYFYRPNDSSLDRKVVLELNAQGRQEIDTANLRAGRWTVKVTWKADGQEYYLDRKVEIRS